MPLPPSEVDHVVEPFAGQGDLIDWFRLSGSTLSIEAYDIDPKREDIVQRDTLANPPVYANTWVLTNPPYLARNKSTAKDLYDRYNTNDLYKCFLLSISGEDRCRGGICIVPAGFFFSSRDVDVRCRNQFMTVYRITKVRYFEETVFEDTPTTVVAIAFEASSTPLHEQQVCWEFLPSKEVRTFTVSAATDWIVGGEIYSLPVPTSVSVRRTVVGDPLRPDEVQTHITLRALDTGSRDGRIGLEYRPGYVYPAKECSRSYATLRIRGLTLTEDEQKELCAEFNQFLEEKRRETCSLFLPQYRESKEYARKRIPFELAYRILLHLILRRTSA